MELLQAFIPSVVLDREKIYYEENMGIKRCIYNYNGTIIKEWRKIDDGKRIVGGGSVIWHQSRPTATSQRIYFEKY